VDKIKNAWIKLDPKKKRLVVMALGLGIAVFVLSNFLFVDPPERAARTEATSLRLTGADTGRFGIDALERRIKKAETENKRLSEKLDKAADAEAMRISVERMERDYKSQIAALDKQIQDGKAESRNAKKPLSKYELTRLVQDEMKSVWSKQQTTPSPNELFEKEELFQAPKPQAQTQPGINLAKGEEPAEEKQATFELIKIESSVSGPPEVEVGRDENSQFFPAGSIISGVLVTGLDAPTNMSSRGEPHPALLRVKKETLMPNFYTGDLEECFVLISGYGDMSSERAYLRSETLSCIDSDKNAVEMPLKAFAVGEDGSAGVRGILVSREGRLIAESLKAGTLSAMAEVFGKTPVPQIITSETGGNQPFQNNLSSESLQSSASRGAGAALERIADYYLDVADQIFPILEIRAGREIDLVLTQGADVAFVP